MNAQANAKEIKEKKIDEEQEISRPTKAAPKEQAAWDNRTVLEKVSSQGSGAKKPS